MSMNKKLGNIALAEIKEAIGRCTTRNQISAEAERLAALYGVSKDRIYAITKDVRPQQKSRADKGKRLADLMECEGLKVAAADVVAYNLDPAEALRQAATRGHEIPVSLATFTRYLREKGLTRKVRRMNNTVTYRRFEAPAPGDVFQFDISGTKERWFDLKTRKLVKVSELEVSKNHENENKNLVKVWRFVLLDDHSRMRFFRFVAVDKPNSSHVVAFLMEAYEEMGVPKVLYTDNDKIIKYARNLRAAHVLNKALESSGGYKLEQHKAGNSRATGKVENAHQWVEKNEKLLGKFMAEGRVLTMDVLNRFAAQLCLEYNHRIHRETGQKPIDRWNAQRHLIRKVDSKILKSALLVDEFEVVINGDLTFKHKGVVYQLPTDQSFQNLIPRQSKTNKIKIVFPENVDFYTLIDFDKNEYDIEKRVATPDVMGEFRSTAEDVSDKTRKELKKFAKEISANEKNLNKQGAEPKPILFIDTDFETPKSNITNFPKPIVDVTPQILEQLPTAQRQANSYDGQLISWYDSVRKFAHFFSTMTECKEFLDTVFKSREEYQPEALVNQAIEDYLTALPRMRVAK